MDFAVISPTAGLERYATLSKTHLVLAQVKDPAYWAFYYNRRKEGDFIILDNGAYEGEPFSPHHYVQKIINLRPHVVTLPDLLLQDTDRSMHFSLGFLYWLESLHETWEHEYCFIPQALEGKDEDWVRCAKYISEKVPEVTYLGLPRALATHIFKKPLARVLLAYVLKDELPNMNLHAFGMVNGDYHELPYLAHAGVNSIDSSAPVYRGLHNIKLETPMDKGMPPVDFNALLEPACHDTIIHNLEVCGVRDNHSR